MNGPGAHDGPGTVRVRTALISDVEAITRLYNATVSTTTVAWTEEPDTIEARRAWFDAHTRAGHAVLVAVLDDEVVGFASYGDFRDSVKWPGYRFTVEHSVHVGEDHWGRGIGTLLLHELTDRARQAGKHSMIGGIDGENEASIRFHERLGFTQVASIPQVGFKFGRWLDLVLVQLLLNERGDDPVDPA